MSQAQRILVTGSASGFGARIARTLAGAGHTVFATMRDPGGRNRARAQALTSAIAGRGKIHVIALDVSDEASVAAGVAEAAGRVDGGQGPGLDAVINNAGIGAGLGMYAETVGMEQFIRAFDVNVFGIHRVTRAALPHLRRRGRGLIVNVSSIMGRVVLPYAAAYTATKFAVEGLTESYRYELSGVGVEVSLLEPGAFPTDFLASIEPGSDPGRAAGYGPLADAPDKMYAGFRDLMASAKAPDPQAVADAALALVEAPAGRRPMRVVIDPVMGGKGPETLNEAAAKVQAGLLEAIGQKHLLESRTLD